MPHPGDKIHIPLPEDEAIRLALKVKPTKDMPRPGAAGKKLMANTDAKYEPQIGDFVFAHGHNGEFQVVQLLPTGGLVRIQALLGRKGLQHFEEVPKGALKRSDPGPNG